MTAKYCRFRPCKHLRIHIVFISCSQSDNAVALQNLAESRIVLANGLGIIMRINSFYGRVVRALGEEAEETSEEIDREVEAAVRAINEMEVSVFDGDSVLGGGWGEAGDMVYNLGP